MQRLPFCVCGVRGGDLRMRIQSIMRGAAQRPLTIMTRLSLASGALAFVVAPVALGALAPRPQAVPLPAPDRPKFDVASVKRNTSDLPGNRFSPTPGRFYAEHVTTRFLIWYAYQIEDFRIVGGPSWLDSDKYDIDARAAGATLAQVRGPMLQQLLEDRFELATHRETREIPVFVLTAARGGSKLPIAKEGACITRAPGAQLAPGQRQADICGFLGFGGNNLRATAIRMTDLVGGFSMHLRRLVVDETGITDMFNVALNWTPDDAPAGAPPADGAPPSFFTAIQEQLGLRLEAARRPGEVLVIDRVERPREN
jgi:uncharacterized protein (TIGR03435 family)